MLTSFYFALKHIFGLNGLPLVLGIILAEYTPFTLLWGTTGLIDWLALLCSIKGYLLIIQGSPIENPKRIIFGTLLVVIAYLIKAPTAVFMSIFVLAHPHFKFGKNMGEILKSLKYYLFATLIAISSIRIWAAWESGLYPASDPRSIWVPNDKTRSWYFGNSNQYRDSLQNIGVVFERMSSTVYGFFPTLLLILVSVVVIKYSRKALIPIIAGTTYVAIFINLNLVHDYYQIPVVFGVLSMIIYTVMQLSKRISQDSFPLILISILVAIVGAGSTMPYFDSQYYVYSLFARYPKIDGCPAPKQIKEPVLLLGGENNPEYLYGCKFEGFMLQNTIADHNSFDKRREDYRFMYLRSNQPALDIKEYLGKYPVNFRKIDQNWYKLVWRSESGKQAKPLD
jgi:hypothetical protein